jgi:hypothetical protein
MTERELIIYPTDRGAPSFHSRNGPKAIVCLALKSMETRLTLGHQIAGLLRVEDFGSLAGKEINWPAQTTFLDSDFLARYHGNLNPIHWLIG